MLRALLDTFIGNVKEETQEQTQAQGQSQSKAETLTQEDMTEPVCFVLGETEEDGVGEELETGDSFPGDKQQNQQQQHVNGLLERRRRLSYRRNL